MTARLKFDVKTLLLIIIGLLMFEMAFCQSKYLSAGWGYSAGAPSYNVEGGIYTNKVWLGAGYDYVAKFQENYVGLKFYYKVVEDKNLALYSYNACKVRTNDGELFFEPGAALVYDLGPVAPQFTATVPLNSSFKATLYYGVGLNIWFPSKK